MKKTKHNNFYILFMFTHSKLLIPNLHLLFAYTQNHALNSNIQCAIGAIDSIGRR